VVKSLLANLKMKSDMPVVLDARVVTGSGGGPDKTILNSPRFFAKAGYRMLCAYMHPPGDRGFDKLRHKAAAWGAPLFSIPDRGAWDWQVITRLLHLCRRQRVQIWHGHDYKSNALGLLLRRFWPMHLVTTVHGWVKTTRRTPLYYKIDQLCLPRYRSVICVSEDLCESCLSAGVPAERCVLIENGIDTEQFRRTQPRAEAKAKLGLTPGRFVIGGVGRLSPEKGFDVLLDAARRLVAEGLDAGVVIAGEGDEHPRLLARARELGIAERVRLLGYCADVRPVFEAMDVFALSSHREGLPNVVLEAMAMETPVAATRIAGVPRLIHDQESGLLVAPGSAEELAQAVARIARDERLQDLLQRNGRRCVETNYSFAGRIDKIRAIYDELLSGPATAPSFSPVSEKPGGREFAENGRLRQSTPAPFLRNGAIDGQVSKTRS
jgi:glycosyltransferase involved in cell wall biosynthesis